MSLTSFIEALRNLTKGKVLIGVPSDATQPHYGVGTVGTNMRQPDPNAAPVTGTGAKPINNATLMYIHTYGDPTHNIPPRPSIPPTIKAQQQQIASRLRDATSAALKGNPGAVDKNLHAIGIETVSATRRYIQQGIPPPLAPATVARRRQRTKGSKYKRKATTAADTTPLIDTAQLLASISYIVKYD